MKAFRILRTCFVLFAGGCALTHYDGLDRKPETDVSVSSNVPAELWINGEKIQNAAKEHILKQTGMTEVVLKAAGYHDARVLLYRNEPYKKNVTSHESSIVWITQESSDVTSNLSDLGADAATTGPTSTVMLPVNVVKFVVDLVVLPFSFTTEFNPFGYYYAYDKNQFYVEMIPDNVSGTEVFNAFKLQVKKFVLKNHAGLARGDAEYVSALKHFSKLREDDIQRALKSARTPAEAAEAVAERLTASGDQ